LFYEIKATDAYNNRKRKRLTNRKARAYKYE